MEYAQSTTRMKLLGMGNRYSEKYLSWRNEWMKSEIGRIPAVQRFGSYQKFHCATETSRELSVAKERNCKNLMKEYKFWEINKTLERSGWHQKRILKKNPRIIFSTEWIGNSYNLWFILSVEVAKQKGRRRIKQIHQSTWSFITDQSKRWRFDNKDNVTEPIEALIKSEK